MTSCRTLLFLLVFGVSTFALPDEDKTVKDEKLNFQVSLPEDSIDWKIIEIPDDLKKKGHAVHLRTVFADTDPEASADFRLIVTPLPKDFVRLSLDKIAKKWAPYMEDHLDNKRDRKEEAVKFGEVDGYKIDVKGNYLAGIHQRTWFLAKNGQHLYLMYVDRNYGAVGDDVLEDEVKSILKSFKFLKVIKVVANKKAKKGATPDAGGPSGKGNKKIDPEKIKRETFKESFWRFTCVKPQGLESKKLSADDKKRHMKLFFAADREGSRLWIQIFAQTDKAKKWTIEDLMKQRLEWWKGEVKVSKDPVIDKKYKFPMAKKAVKLELVGRQRTTRRRTWIFADCKNDRQYILSIYTSGTMGAKVWKRHIDEFLKNFKPVKR